MLFHKHNMPLNLSSGLRMIRWGNSAPRPSWARLACTNASAGPDTMQLQREDLTAETEQYDTNTMQSQCEDLIAGTEQCSTMQSQSLDLIAQTEQCEDLHWTQEWAPLSCCGNWAPDLFAGWVAMMQYTQQHNNEDDKDDGIHDDNEDQVDDAGDQFVSHPLTKWPFCVLSLQLFYKLC